MAGGRVWRVKVIRQGEDINGKWAMKSEPQEEGRMRLEEEIRIEITGLRTQRTRFGLCALFVVPCTRGSCAWFSRTTQSVEVKHNSE